MVTKNKTPAEVEAVTITMSRETAQAVKQACEEYLRFRMGQFEDFTNEVCCWDYVDKMEKECFTCAWHDNFSWVCFNGNSEHRADFTDPEDSCPVWEGREDSDEKEEK